MSISSIPFEFPGKSPGEAIALLKGSSFHLENNVFLLKCIFSNNRLIIDNFVDKLNNESINLSINQLFSIELKNGTVINSEDMVATEPMVIEKYGNPNSVKLSRRDNCKRIKIKFKYDNRGLEFSIDYYITVRDNSNNIQNKFIITSLSQDMEFNSIKLIDVNIPYAKVAGLDDGSPVTAENVFMGFENPLSKAKINQDNVCMYINPSNKLLKDDHFTYTTSIGIVPEGQMRRGFLYYLERERVHYRRSMLHYQTWFDLVPPGSFTEEDVINEIKLFGTELKQKRKVPIKCYMFDDGWDDIKKPVWTFDYTALPNEFRNINRTAENFEGHLATWMSPFGGYNPKKAERLKTNAKLEQPYETDGEGFRLSGEQYYNRFKEVAFDMMDNQGIVMFKFDGIGGGVYQTGPNEKYRTDFESLLRLALDLRKHNEDIFINATVGTWGSPYWLFYVDSIWRDGYDIGNSGEGSYREKYINYRDSQVYNNFVKENPLVPINNLMLHGIIFSNRKDAYGSIPVMNNDLSDITVRQEVIKDFKTYFSSGLALQELYIQGSLVKDSEFFWDELAKQTNWCNENFSLLQDSHWIGGDPKKGEVYGNASWSSSKACFMLRNPSEKVQQFQLILGDIFELQKGNITHFHLIEKDGLRKDLHLTADAIYNFVLKPFEVVMYESFPENR